MKNIRISIACLMILCFILTPLKVESYGYKMVRMGTYPHKCYIDNYDYENDTSKVDVSGTRKNITVSLREILEHYGYNASWNSYNKISSFSKENKRLLIKTETLSSVLNGSSVKSAEPIRLHDGKTFASLDFVNFMGESVVFLEFKPNKDKPSYKKEISNFYFEPLNLKRSLTMTEKESAVFGEMAVGLLNADLPDFKKSEIDDNLILNYALKNALTYDEYKKITLRDGKRVADFSLKTVNEYAGEVFGKTLSSSAFKTVLNSGHALNKRDMTSVEYRSPCFSVTTATFRPEIRNSAEIFAMDNVGGNLYNIYFNGYTTGVSSNPVFEGTFMFSVELKGTKYELTGFKAYIK